MIEDPRIDPPEPSDISETVWDMDLHDVVDELVRLGTDVEDDLKDRLIDIYENEQG